MKKIWALISIAILCLSLAVVAVGCGDGDVISTGDDRNAEIPVITQQPKDAVLRKGEESQGLEIKSYANDNGTLSYQWYGNTTDSNTGGTAIEGANNSVLALDSSVDGTTYYYCVVTNTANFVGEQKTASTVSNVARVKVYSNAETPRILTQPSPCKYIIGAQAAALPLDVDAAVSVGDLTYQWFVSDTGSYDEADELIGETTSKYVPNISENGKNYYYCEVTNTDTTASETQTSVIRSKIVLISVDYDFEGFKFESVDETTCKLTEYTGESLYPYIPNTDKEGRVVTAIGAGVFNQKSIIEVTIPDTVEILGVNRPELPYGEPNDGVFNSCTSLKKIHYGGKFKFVGDFSFQKCSSLETKIFDYCSEMEFMGKGAFGRLNCLPEELIIPASMTGEIPKYAFEASNNIKKITFAGNGVKTAWSVGFGSIQSLEEVVFPTSMEVLNPDVLKLCPNLKSVTYLRSVSEHGSITTGNPFLAPVSSYPDLKIYVPADSYSQYVAALGNFSTCIVAPPPQQHTLTVEGATIDGQSTLRLFSEDTLNEESVVVYEDEAACLGWVYNGRYFETYAELAQSFKMGTGDALLRAVYNKDFTQPFTPSCRSENLADKSIKIMKHETVNGNVGTRYVFDSNVNFKIVNGANRETHGEADGVYNSCPVYNDGKSSFLMTFVNNSDEAITLRYEAEYYGVIGSVTVELAANETKTTLLVLAIAKDSSVTAHHQFHITSGGENGYDITVYGMLPNPV